MNGNPPPATFSDDHHPAHAANIKETDGQILRALELVYDPRTSKEHRDDASRFLEQLKSQSEAPAHGYVLAANKSHPAVVRHYGLSLLEDPIRRRWADYSSEQGAALREWVLKLAQRASREDPLFIRNKIAQLWVEVAKRSWALDWMDMDEALVKLWGGSIVQKELVLEVLETLSENSFGKEDTTTALRGNDLGKACVEIFTPAQVMADHFPKRDTSIHVRFGREGWLLRISELLSWCYNGGQDNTELQTCAIKALSTLKSVFYWVILKAVAATSCVPRVCECLTVSNQAMQLVAVEALYTLYNRSNYSDDDVQDLVWPMYQHETVNTLRKLYEWSVVDATNIDEERYLLCKKFAEMIHNIGRFLDLNSDIIPQDADIPNFLELLLSIVQNDSLHVSIPILHLWIQVLGSHITGDLPSVMSLIGRLLEVCSYRLLKYEALPQESRVPSILFLNEDVDTVPERHAFLGNYARFCKDVVDCIVQKQPFDALNHILSQTDQVIEHLYDMDRPLQALNYNKTSVPALKLDAQFSVIEAGLMGYGRWRAIQRARDADALPALVLPINQNLEQWCMRLMDRTFEDPTIQQRTVNLAGEFVETTLRKSTTSVVRVFRFMLDTMIRFTSVAEQANAFVYNDAVKECRRYCTFQLQRLALRSADHLVGAYDDIAAGINRYCQMSAVEQQDRDRCFSVLFVIIQRAAGMDEKQREARLEEFIQPVIERWRDPVLTASLRTFTGFCELLGLSNLQNYLLSRRVNEIEDWAATPLDEGGKALKSAIEAAQNNVPLRAAKAFLGVSVERTEPGTLASDVAMALWTKYLPVMLPNLLQLISHAHSFSDPASWGDLPPELRGLPGRVLRDRYWQVGISSGTREDFYSQIEESKVTMEGLASTIRSSLRMVREVSYRLLFSMSLLGGALYSYKELPEPLAKALFTDAAALTIHQTGIILAGLPSLIYNCPPEARAHFIPPILTAMFDFLDRKVSTEWERIDQRSKAAAPDDDLIEEMKDEAILRQLTNTSVQVVVRLLEPDPLPEASRNGHSKSEPPPPPAPTPLSLRDFILDTPPVLKSVILFCTHALRMHDNRACGLLTRVLRTIIPIFTAPTAVAAEVREFIATEVLKACIESLHDPYFVDIQSDLAQLIASILLAYAEQTDTPRAILLSLPGMDASRVDAAVFRLWKASEGRQQRAVVLKLLEGLRGVSVSEMGRLPRPEGKKRGGLVEKYLVDLTSALAVRGTSPDLGGVADMFS